MINPQVIRFLVALVIIGFLIDAISRVNETAAWALVSIFVIGFLLENPLAIGFITLGANSLAEGVSK